MVLYKNGEEETCQRPGAYNEREIKGMIVLCSRNCWKTKGEKIYFPNGKCRGTKWEECLFHSRNPGCGIAEIFLEQYRIFWILKENGHL